MRKLKYTRWIDKYLSGNMPEEKRRRFESELKVNPRLKEEYWLRNAVDEILEMRALKRKIESDPYAEEAERLAEEAVREFLEEQPSVGPPSPRSLGAAGDETVNSDGLTVKQRRSRSIRWIAVAASVAVLVSVILFLTSRPPSANKLFRHYYAELSAEEIVEEGMPEDVVTSMLRGIALFETNDYPSALVAFEGIDSYKEQYPQISLFKGLVRLEIGQYTLAIEDFEACAKPDSRWRKYARWFQGISYLRLGNPKNAAFYILEKTGADKNFSEGAQKLIRHVNLFNTGQWRELRRSINPDAEGPLVLHRDDIIAILFILVFMIIIPAIMIVDIWRHDFENNMKKYLFLIVIFMPLAGPVAYLFLRKRLKK